VVGIMGGSSGTTFDAFHTLWEAKKHGARAALYGRKINNSEHQLAFVHILRLVANDQIPPDEAVRAYHGALQKLGIRPYRSLEDDLKRTSTWSTGATAGLPGLARPDTRADKLPMAPGGNSGQAALATREARTTSRPSDEPDFSKMTPAEKARWNLDRWKRILG
jgi:hypothetical protein